MIMPAEYPDATIEIRTPGRRRDVAPVELPAAPPAGREASAADLGALGGLNPLIAAANPVLAVVPQIRHALRHPDPDGLRVGLRERLDAFESEARAAGTGDEALANASFALGPLRGAWRSGSPARAPRCCSRCFTSPSVFRSARCRIRWHATWRS